MAQARRVSGFRTRPMKLSRTDGHSVDHPLSSGCRYGLTAPLLRGARPASRTGVSALPAPLSPRTGADRVEPSISETEKWIQQRELALASHKRGPTQSGVEADVRELIYCFAGQPAGASPFGPLLRVARLVGPGTLRMLASMAAERGNSRYRIELRPRMDSEYRRGNVGKRVRTRQAAIEFGNRVLSLERTENLGRGLAMERAAEELNAVAAARTQERQWRAFCRLCRKLGYVPSVLDHLGFPPAFALSDLVPPNRRSGLSET